MEKLDKKVLDEIIVGRVIPHIYAFSTNTIPNYIKVGDTYRPVDIRLKEWAQHFSSPKQLFMEQATINNDIFFRDYSVHQYLEKDLRKQRLQKSDIPDDIYYSQEFFKDITIGHLTDAIKDIKRDYKEKTHKYSFYNLSDRQQAEERYERESGWKLRENQKEVVDNFKLAIKKGHTNLLMYAVMRFGKSFTSLHCGKAMDAKSIIVVSAKADVKEEWKRTVQKATGFDQYEFVTAIDLHRDKKLLSKLISNQKIPVVFLTLEDLQGKLVKEKHKEVFTTKFDLLIIDETHFGARAEKFGEVLREKITTKETNELDREEFVDEEQAEATIAKYINAKIKLHLSGTPYRILMGSEFGPEQIIAFCQFTDIIDAKNKKAKDLSDKDEDEWKNPYYGFPQMIRFAFNPNKSAQQKIDKLARDGKVVAMGELFRPQSTHKSTDNSHKKFVHEKEVLDFLEIIDGSKDDPNILGFLNYNKIKKGNMCRHIVMVLPYCASCDALEHLLSVNQNKFMNLKDYQIINISGIDNPNLYKDTNAVKYAICNNEKQNKKTITLTVNRMLTGSTVEQWDTMIFLKDTASPQDYDQAIFRLQNPYIRTYQNSEGKTIKYDMKPQTLLVDFHPNRMFRMQELKAQCYNANADKAGNSKLESRIRKELEVSPILFVNKNKIDKAQSADIMAAVSEYSRNRGVLEETNEIPVDLSVLDTCEDLRFVIENENELGDKGGLSFKANEGEGTDYEGDLDNEGNDHSKMDNVGAKDQGEKNDAASLERKFRTYYSRILFFAFLSSTRLNSLEEIIAIIDKAENKRIAKNLGIDKRILELLQENINRFTLSKLDYKIQNISKLSTDEQSTPLQRAMVAINKFGRLGESEVVTPLEICRKMVSLIPDMAFNEAVDKGYKMLDIASKTGEFTIALYEKFKKLDIKDVKIKDAIYAIPTSSVSYEFTRKIYEILGLNCDNIAQKFNSYDLLSIKSESQKDVDTKRIGDILTQNKPFNTISMQDISEGEINMIKFEAVVGNPPYQISDGGGTGDSAKPIYQFFIEQSKQINPRYVTMIVPSRWMKGGKGLDKFRDIMMDDRRIKILYDYENAKTYFTGLHIDGGVCYFLWDRCYSGKVEYHFKALDGTSNTSKRFLRSGCTDTVIRDSRQISIIEKVIRLKESKFSTIVSSRNPYGFFADLFNNPEKYSFVKIYDKPKTGLYKVYGVKGKKGGSKRVFGYVKKECIKKNLLAANNYKLFFSKAYMTTSTVPPEIIIGTPRTVCTETFLQIGYFDKQQKNINCLNYIKTKFFRALLFFNRHSLNISKESFSLIPIQDFNKSWTDTKLYKKYGLTTEEINFIESTIKTMK